MSAKVYILPGKPRRRDECPGDYDPPRPLDRRDAVFRCLVGLAEAQTYHDPDRFLNDLWAQGFMVVRMQDHAL